MATRVDTVEDTIFGVAVKDPYRWLEQSSSTEVQAWVRAENELAHDYLQKIPGREELRKRLKELIATDTVSVPQRRGRRFFYTRRRASQGQAVLVWRDEKSSFECGARRRRFG